MRNKKIIISIFLISVVLVTGMHFLNKKNDISKISIQTLNSKNINILTYKNITDGIQFDYPEEINGSKVKIVKIGSYIFVVNEKSDLLKKEFVSKLEKLSEPQKLKEIDSNFGDLYFWRISLENNVDDSSLDQFIAREFSTAIGNCDRVGNLVESSIKGTYDVFVESYSGEDIDNIPPHQCLTNFGYYMKYSYTNKQVAFWETGQESITDLKQGSYTCNNISNCNIDSIIPNSFHFISKGN